jgi:hypothetical protein
VSKPDSYSEPPFGPFALRFAGSFEFCEFFYIFLAADDWWLRFTPAGQPDWPADEPVLDLLRREA